MWIGPFPQKATVFHEDVHKDLDVIVAATLTMLALIIGFSFSMAISRYDERKTYEEAEANAIGTEYVRAGLLPAADGARVRALLKDYLDQRILFFTDLAMRLSHSRLLLPHSQLQTELWSAVQALAAAQPLPTLVPPITGMNDVLNSQGYTQAAWWNRIPVAAWGLMAGIAICSNLLVSYSRHRPNAGFIRFLVLPLILSIAFYAIADIDSLAQRHHSRDSGKPDKPCSVPPWSQRLINFPQPEPVPAA